jgi:hypothetical protein
MKELPIACSLGAAALQEREELIARLRDDAFARGERTERGVRLYLRDDEGVETRVRQLIGLESECCPFLEFSLGREGGELVLAVEGPPDARPIVDAFLGPREATTKS